MSGQIVHTEIPADDTGKGKAFWSSLFGWEFDAFPGPSEYHMARLSDTLRRGHHEHGARQARDAVVLRRRRHR